MDPGVYVYVAVVLATLVHTAAGSSLLSHLTTEPVRPARVRVVLEPIHIGVVPVTVPPTERGLTLTANVLEGEGQRGSLVYLLMTLTVLLPAVPPTSTVICLVP